MGIAVDATGVIYVADSGNHRIQKWVPGAMAGVTVAGGNGNGAGDQGLSLASLAQFDGARSGSAL